VLTSPPKAKPYNFTPIFFSYPDADSTTVSGINSVTTPGSFINNGQIGQLTGAFLTTPLGPLWQGYFGLIGSLNPFGISGSVVTSGYGINDRDLIVGLYVQQWGPPEISSGFRYNLDEFFDMGGSANAANDNGDIVGGDADGGFLYHNSNGSYTTINFPGSSGSNAPLGINGIGEFVGWYADNSGTIVGYTNVPGQPHGGWRAYSFPGSIYTEITGVNNNGQVVGCYQDSADYDHGFFADGVNPPVTIDVGGPSAFTCLYGINDSGQIVGSSSMGTFVLAPN
jgi:uncharacterized membrane protein